MSNLTALVIGDVALVMLACWILGGLARRLGQPPVIGQIVAGILLGPTLLGRLPGHLTEHLFPKSAVSALSVLAQIAVVIFMFGVGYEMDRRFLLTRWLAAALVAVGAFAVPMALGSGAAVLFRSGFASTGSRGGGSFVLFMGVAVSVTALPVMAAIIRDRGIAGTPAGVIAVSAAGIMDVAAWLVLAVVLVGKSGGTGRPANVTLAEICGFTAAMLLIVRPVLGRFLSRRSLLTGQLTVALILALGSAWVTASLGLQAVFGGFLAGLTMPHPDGAPDPEVLRPLEDIGNLLLPLFFVVTGLSLDIGALHGTDFALLGLVCVIAIVGKIGPGYAAARLSRMPPREAGAVAALVNTRGLTELIALNVGLSAGVIGPQLFTVLVLMAIIATLMTSPLLSSIRPPRPESAVAGAGDAGVPAAAVGQGEGE